MRFSQRLVDKGWRIAYRVAYPLARCWWRLRGCEGVRIALWCDGKVLAVLHSYKPGLQIPAGGVKRKEPHRMTAVRELREEVGITVAPAQLTLAVSYDSRYGWVHVYEMHVTDPPALKIDRREIIHAEFVPPDVIGAEGSGILRRYLCEHERLRKLAA